MTLQSRMAYAMNIVRFKCAVPGATIRSPAELLRRVVPYDSLYTAREAHQQSLVNEAMMLYQDRMVDLNRNKPFFKEDLYRDLASAVQLSPGNEYDIGATLANVVRVASEHVPGCTNEEATRLTSVIHADSDQATHHTYRCFIELADKIPAILLLVVAMEDRYVADNDPLISGLGGCLNIWLFAVPQDDARQPENAGTAPSRGNILAAISEQPE